jgi:type IV secretion system protein VirB10
VPSVTSYTVPAGTKVLLSLKSGVNTKTARPGDGVYLVSTFPVIVGSHVLIPTGVYVQGVVDKVERPGRVKGRAKLLMHFTTMIFPNGQVVGIPGTVDSLPGSAGPSVKGEEGTIEQASNKGKDAGNIAKGGAIGASGGVIGGAASGRPLEGAAIGGLAGVAGGLVYTLFTRGDDVVIPEGTSLEMVMQRPLELQASQLDGMGDAHVNPQYIPTRGQAQPLSKPAHVICPPGGLGCN